MSPSAPLQGHVGVMVVKLYWILENKEKAKYPTIQGITLPVCCIQTSADYFERWSDTVIFVTCSESRQELSTITFLGPYSAALAGAVLKSKTPGGGLNMAPAQEDQKGRDQRIGRSQVSLRRVHKWRENSPTVDHSTRGMQRDKQFVLSSDLFPSRTAQIQRIVQELH